MKSKMVLSAVGSDRPGLTQAIAEAVFAAGGNWLESHLSRLGGKYTGSVLIELDAENLGALERALRGVDGAGLHVSVVPAGEEPAEAGEALSFELVGQDRPGIVREVTAVLTALQVNIEDFETRIEPSSWSGAPLFRAAARLTIPPGTSREQVQTALETISGEIMVDFTLAAPKA